MARAGDLVRANAAPPPPPAVVKTPPPVPNTPPPVLNTPPPVAMAPPAPPAMPPQAPPMTATATSPLVSDGPSRTRKLVLMGCGAALPLIIALLVGLRSPGGGKANASVVTPAPSAAAETSQLAAVSPEIAPHEVPPPAAAPDTDPAPRRHAVRAKRKPSVAHHGKRQPRQEARPVAKAARQQRTLVAKASKPTPAAPAERGDPRADYERGNALLFAGNAAGAIAAYREAIHQAPGDPIGYRGLGLAYEQKGDTTAAIRALRKYLKLAPDAADRSIISRRIERLGKHAGAK
jgi:hypothetical protein